MTHSIKRAIQILSSLLLLFVVSCTDDEAVHTESVGTEGSLQVNISTLQETNPGASRVAYSGAQGEHTEFETGDFFGLFVLGDDGTVKSSNVKVYCSGLDNKGATVWSIYKEGGMQGNSSNYPLSELLSQGAAYFAYFPYDDSLNGVTDAEGLQLYVMDFMETLVSDQSRSLTDYDLLVASNVAGCEYGSVSVEGRSVSLTFAHTLAMLRFHLPQGAEKYDYLLGGEDFTPYFMGSADGRDEYRFLFKPGCILDICVKYLLNGKLYRFETGRWKELRPIHTASGYCYTLDESAIKVPYNTAVDMGTSVMWASFNLGAEEDPTATVENLGMLKGSCVMWGANNDTGNYGNSAYTAYNNSFTDGVKPNKLPLGYCFTGDPVYDAATNLWGGLWRIPTVAEWQELFQVCSYSMANGLVTFTSKKTGNVITLKAAGYYDSNTPTSTSTGYYWSSCASTTNSVKASSTMFGGSPSIHTNASRYTGLPVRPVFSK